MRIWNQWFFRQNFLLLTPFLRRIPKYKETCCVNTSRKSQNFLNNRNWPNSAPMLVSRRTLRKDTSSLHLMRLHLTIWKDHVESISRGSVETRRSVQSWDVKVCYHQGRFGVEIMIQSLFRDRTVPWVRIVNGINNYETETSEEIPVASVEIRSTGKLVAKAKLLPKPTLTLSPVSIPCVERKWIDGEPGEFSQGCLEVSNFMIRLLRHDESVHRKEDRAVRFDDLAELLRSRFAGTSHWSIEAWISLLAKRGGPKKRFQYCMNPNSSKHFPYFRAI